MTTLRRVRSMTWASAASTPLSELTAMVESISVVPLPPVDAAGLSPEGFHPRVPRIGNVTGRATVRTSGGDLYVMDVARPDVVPVGRYIDRASIRNLRRYRYAVIDELSWASPSAVATAVVSLSLAGVLVETRSLSRAVRAMLDAVMLGVTDDVGPETTNDDHGREALSLQLRRRAREVYGFAPQQGHRHPIVSVVIEARSTIETSRLLEELARQTWPSIRTHLVPVGAKNPRSEIAKVGALYVTRFEPTNTYGPHHLEDLVHALRHSGAAAAHTVSRFTYHRAHRILLEAYPLIGEVTADEGAPGGSLWYAPAGGGSPGSGLPPGYQVHGCNLVALDSAPQDEVRSPRKVYRSLPPQVEWLRRMDELLPPSGARESYFSTANRCARA